MNRNSGFLVSEIFTAGLIVIVIAAVGFGIHLNGVRDTMVENAQASIAKVKAQAAAAAEGGALVACDNSLVEASVLANEFVTMTIKPTPINKFGLGQGYAPGVYFESKRAEDSADTYATTELIYKAFKEAEDQDVLRQVTIEEDDEEIEFSVLVADRATCIDPAAQLVDLTNAKD